MGRQAASGLSPPMQRWRRAVAGVRAGTGRARLLVIGDSTSMGAGAGTGGTAMLDAAYARAWPQVLVELLIGTIPTVCQSIVGNQNASIAYTAYDPRATLGAGWVVGGTLSVGGQIWTHTAGSAGTFAFTPAGAFDTITVYYLTAGNNGTIAVNIDGGAALGTINCDGPQGFLSVTYTCTLGPHTINLVADGAAMCSFGGIIAADSTAPAIDVVQGARLGGHAIHFAIGAAPWQPLNALPAYAPDLTIINLTINDSNNDTPLAEYRAQMQQIISAARITGDVLLMVGAPSDTAQATDGLLDRFIAVLTELAFTHGCTLLNLKERWGSYAAIQTAFPYNDKVHPGALANRDQAQAVYAALGLMEQTAPVIRRSVWTRPISMIAAWIRRVWSLFAK